MAWTFYWIAVYVRFYWIVVYVRLDGSPDFEVGLRLADAHSIDLHI